MRCKLWGWRRKTADNVVDFAHKIRSLAAGCDLQQLEDALSRDVFIYNLGWRPWSDEPIARTLATFGEAIKVAEVFEWEIS